MNVGSSALLNVVKIIKNSENKGESKVNRTQLLHTRDDLNDGIPTIYGAGYEQAKELQMMISFLQVSFNDVLA